MKEFFAAGSAAVAVFLDNLRHPMREQIDQLRCVILTANNGLTEGIKWNGPNYSFNGADRFTMRLHPTTSLQIIFHRGAKVLALPATNLISDSSGLLVWRTTDRAIATFKTAADITANEKNLQVLINDWLMAST